MLRLVALPALVPLVCACAGSPPSGAPAELSLLPPPNASPRPTAPLRPAAPTIAWQHDLPPRVEARRVAIGVDATIAVGVHFSGSVELGGRGFTSRGEGDVAIAVFAADGAPLGAVQLGGPADDALEALSPSASGFVVAVRSDESFVEAGRTAEAGPGLEGAALVVHVRAPGEVVRADAVPRGARGLRLASHESGDLFIGWSVRGDEELFGEAIVIRSGVQGVERWRKAFSRCELYRLAAGHDAVVASLRCDRSLEARSLGERDGTPGLGLRVEKLPSAGDLGTLEAFAHEGALVAFGETGGVVRVAGAEHERPSYAIQPFHSETTGPDAARFVDLADATAQVVGVGVLDDTPAAVLDVIHAGKGPEPQPGVYLAVALPGSVPALRPLAPHDAHPDRPEPPLDPRHAAFVDGGVVVVGTLGTKSRYGTVVRYDLPRLR